MNVGDAAIPGKTSAMYATNPSEGIEERKWMKQITRAVRMLRCRDHLLSVECEGRVHPSV